VLQSRNFWRIAPFTTFSQAAFLAIQGLWAGPWLRDVAGLQRSTVAVNLLLVAAAMVAGFLCMGTLAYRLSQIGVKPILVASTGMVIFMLIQLVLIVGPSSVALPLWVGFGFFGTSAIVMYAVLSQGFPGELTGRVNTALNLLVFIAAFAGQWGIGAIIDVWPSDNGGYDPQGYQVAFAVVLALQGLAFGWFVLRKQ
jgi:predicted MFS family arabinose efflux permease